MSAALEIRDEGICEYQKTYELQRSLIAQRRTNALDHDCLIFVQHPDVYTQGRKGPAFEVPTVKIERGGETTFHTPGQLVCYPILKLAESERDLHRYLRTLERVLVNVLFEFGISGESREGLTGVWVKGKSKKIASIGVAVSGWVTYHGCALNVTNDLSGFHRISPCGLAPDVMTSMRVELGERCPSIEEVKKSFASVFAGHFGRNFVTPLAWF